MTKSKCVSDDTLGLNQKLIQVPISVEEQKAMHQKKKVEKK